MPFNHYYADLWHDCISILRKFFNLFEVLSLEEAKDLPQKTT